MKRNMLLKVFCIFMACVLCFTLVPATGFATEADDTSSAVELATEPAEATEATEETENSATSNGEAAQEQTSEAAAEEETEEDSEEETLVVQSEEATAETVAQTEGAALSTQSEKEEESAVAAESTTGAAAQLANVTSATVVYRTHVQDIGWQGWKTNGAMAGTAHQSKRLEAIEIGVKVPGVSGGVRYRVHRQDYGWETSWNYDGAQSGTTGQSKRLEAIYIELTGDLANKYDVYYRVHVQDIGWQGWRENGELAGTTGRSKRLEAIEIKLMRKGSSNVEVIDGANVNYNVHAQDYGWMATEVDGAIAGTTGESKRLEALNIKLGSSISGGIRYRAHVQDIGWQDWSYDGAMAGTSHQSKRLEALKIELTGDAATNYNVWYRVHIQDYGWLDWASNGEMAGSSGRSKRMEAMQIMVLPKSASAPGSTGMPCVTKSLIYLDSGHGNSGSVGYDSGAVGCGYVEADLNEELVTKVASIARNTYGLTVYSNIGCNKHYTERQAHAKSVGATSLVSFHFNASDSSAAHGTETYIYRAYGNYNGAAASGSSTLQKIVHNRLVGALGLYDRGMKSEAFAVVNGKNTGIPATLMEVAFITNRGDMNTYQAKKEQVAQALAKALYEASQQGF